MIKPIQVSAAFLLFATLLSATSLNADDGKHLFVLTGQSNMAGLRPAESFTPTVEKEFGKDNVIVVHDAQGGQPIRRWHKGWKTQSGAKTEKIGDLYDRLMKKVTAAISNKKISTVTLLWMQGERDAREKNGDVYGASLKGLVDQVAKDLKHDAVNFVIGRLSDFDMENKRYPHWTKIREVQVKFAKDHPRTEWVDTDDLNDGKNRRDKEIKNDLHYSADGYVTFGTRLAEKAILLIRGKAKSEPKGVKAQHAGITQYVSLVQGDLGGVESQKVDLNNAKPDKIVPYKKVGDVELKLHVFHPESHQPADAKPAIVFFFGGGWVGGTPTQFYKQSRYLAERGMVAICAEYRIRSKHKTTPVECVKDGKSAIRFVRAHAKKLGIDPKRLAAGGGSAGGHVAASTATVTKFNEETDKLDFNPVPNALVLFNPVYDNSKNGYGYDRVKEYWEDISPMHNLSKNTPPTIVFLGTKDKLIPVATAEAYKKKMEGLGCRSDLHLYKDKPHGFFNRGEEFVDTVEKMDQFLVSLKFLSGKSNIRELLPSGPAAKSKKK